MKKLTYRKAGVDINKANRLIDRIKPLVASTKREGWVGNIGAFAGFFKPNMAKYKKPLLIASTDGVGTKLMIAQAADKHDTVGIDLVAMCVNDLISCGAEPLFFLDYFASGKLKPHVMYEAMKGIVKGCKLSNSALIGGETAELPGMYADGVYDMAGFSLGVVDKDKIIDGSKIKAGDVVLGIQSSGLHSNGYSMVRKVFSKKELLKGSIAKDVLEPTIIYVKPILDLIKNFKIKGIANITGGGFYDNIIRILPKGVAAVIFKKSWEIPSIFQKIQKKGNVDDPEMLKTFNMGIGMVVVMSPKEIWKAKNILKKRHNLASWRIGEIVSGRHRVELIDL
ncbi:MAG: phosphoribosylformylglycinamidine cyclo-ligase [Candidatus Omnitrophica bacterium]|nr:phosphoribosylformylglycinamidine cyclo-ligase [Candidatus Omnitrophota bacterium]